jgi:flagellar motor switch protein FliM
MADLSEPDMKGAKAAVSSDTEPPIEAYDFNKQNRIPKEQHSTISVIYESYCETAALNLSAFLRSEVVIQLESVEQISFQEYLSSINNPTCIATFDMQPLSGFGVIEVNAALVFNVIDKMLGGDGSHQDIVRNFTDIELSIARKLLNLLLTNLSDSWNHILTIAFGLQDVQTNPAFIRVIPAREACITACMKVSLGDISEMITICLPYATLEPIAGKLRNDQHNRFQSKPSDDVQSAHKRNFSSLSVKSDAILGSMDISMEDLLRLQVGDILDTGHRAKEPIDLHVSGQPKFKVNPGLVGRHRGIIIANEITKE